MFIFIFQTIWLFIDDLAGKDLDIWIIGKFLLYYMPTLIDKVLPLTVLLSSILTFGTFAENYEFAAMKASGISLQKAMRSIIVFVVLLGIGTFFLSNNVIPASEQKIFNMRRNIAKVKPAAVIVEGVFSDIEGSDMNIKVDKKSGEKDRILEGVVIHQKSKSSVNTTVIKANDGELVSDEQSDIIQLILNDGHYYEELKPKSNKEKKKHPFTRARFDTYIKNIDISSLNNQDFEQETDITTDKMKNIVRLNKDIDSLKDNNVKIVKAFSKNIINRMGVFPIGKDSVQNEEERPQPKTLTAEVPDKKIDSIQNAEDLLQAFPEWQRLQLLGNAKNSVTSLLSTVKSKKTELNRRYEVYNRHILSLHKKFAFAFSCIILFFVGAPLGAIIRKGGLGLPMVIAIVLFLTYHFIGVFADNSAKKGAINPIFGAWLSTLIMLPLGVFLTKRATADKGLMSFGNVVDVIKSLFRKKENDSAEEVFLEGKLNISRYVSEEELSLLLKSLDLIRLFPENISINSSLEYLKIHDRNIKSLKDIASTDNSGIILNLLNKYPSISKSEIDFYIQDKKKNKGATEVFIGRLPALIVQLVKTKGNTLLDIKAKLEHIARINNSLTQMLKNTF